MGASSVCETAPNSPVSTWTPENRPARWLTAYR